MEEEKQLKEQLQKKIAQLLSNEASREEISEWAFSIIDDDYIFVDDQALWKILQCLGAVDLPAPDRDFLYEKDDFVSWLKELE